MHSPELLFWLTTLAGTQRIENPQFPEFHFHILPVKKKRFKKSQAKKIKIKSLKILKKYFIFNLTVHLKALTIPQGLKSMFQINTC